MKQSATIRVIYSSEITTGYCSKINIKPCDIIIAETTQGVEAARVLTEPVPMEAKPNKQDLKILRLATEEDLSRIEENKKNNENAFKLCKEKIVKHELPMKLVKAHHFLDGNKILFYFTSEGRVDFRNLVKDLASVFRTRIELRQIGVRDEAQIVGGHGICGRELCCHNCKPMTQPVAIKMAKEQNIALNSSKISGVCGRLLCCLAYEYETYKKMNKNFPKVGSKIWVGEEKMVVKDVNIQTQKIKIMSENHKYMDIDNSKIKINKITGRKFIEVEKKQ